jgi:hypothetical protein
MKKARKAHGDKVILDDVTLMFLPGAKLVFLAQMALENQRSFKLWQVCSNHQMVRPI